MSTQTQSETEVVTGTVTHTITKGPDKWQVAVQPAGSQYTKNLWTKDAALVSQMNGAIGQAFDFICGASYWQNNEGKQVRSLWINSLAIAGSTPHPAPAEQQQQALPPQPAQQQPTQQPSSPQVQGSPGLAPMEKEERIMREAAMKVAAHMLPYMRPEERSLPGMVTVAEGLIRYYREGASAVNGNPGAYDDEVDDLIQQGVLVEDTGGDDIPF